MSELGKQMCVFTYNSESVQRFLNENIKFDVILMEHFNTNCFLSVARFFNAPVVRLQTCKMMPWTSHRFGNPNNPAYISNTFSPYIQRMSFFQRVENTLVTFFWGFYFNNIVVHNDKEMSVKYFGDLGATLYSDILNDSLLLTATLVPNIIEVGGIHIGQPKNLAKVRL